MSEDLFAPEGGWSVRILDLLGASEDNVVETIKGFPTLMQANAFCRAYVLDSIERCRLPGTAPRDVLQAWFSYGEDAEVVDAGENGWRSANELDDFASRSATESERDWRSLDPRRDDEDEADAIGVDGEPAEAAHEDEDDDEMPPPPIPRTGRN